MRKSERIISEGRHKLPERYRKIDTAVNGDAEELVEKHKEVEKKLFPLRIDKRTVIYVTKDKLTKEYADMSRDKFSHKLDGISPAKGGYTPISLDEESIKSMMDGGMTLKEMARRMGVSRTTISNYIRKYNLSNGKG